ncbi:neuraminidase-like domain-containing protein [Massilia sp. Dwa41.01b]|uniref:neuraminidase-like domain-containing protein n=1 Tax=Massilia sp. Dwa41.01b TaxID=2709302 RepID=UPI0028045500|nr:neuraminidase-like domain-containing protein [Massilia sp. Dwa41.01b]
MRRAVLRGAGRQAWLSFVEAANQQPADVAPLLIDLGIDLDHAPLLLAFHEGVAIDWPRLADERWALRLWHAAQWVRQLLRHFVPRDLGLAQPAAWAGDDGAALAAANAGLTRFYRDGMIERGEPRRYLDLERLNNELRERARTALLAYLCGMDRVALPFAPGTHARVPRDLSALLLLDTEAGICQRASRVEELTGALQAFVERARLREEPTLPPVAAFTAAWDARFASFHLWQACRRRQLYAENHVEWSEHAQAIRSEAFRFLESELRRHTLSAPVPGGMLHWPGPHWPAHAPLATLQAREPSTLAQRPHPQNLGLMGMPGRHARPAWLAPLGAAAQPPRDDENPNDPNNPNGPGKPKTRTACRTARVPARRFLPQATPSSHRSGCRRRCGWGRASCALPRPPSPRPAHRSVRSYPRQAPAAPSADASTRR